MALTELNMVIDRTALDVERWRALRKKGYEAMTDAEKVEWISGEMKGAYNVSDLNRVGLALNYLLEALADVGNISGGLFVAKTDWAEDDIPTAKDLSDYLSYVSLIRGATKHLSDTPSVPPDTGMLNYSSANDIEKILLASEHMLHNMRRAWLFGDDLYCGEV